MTHESYEAFIGPRNTISDDGAVPASSAPALSPEGESGQTAKAIEAFQQAVRINPEHAKAWFDLGIAYGKSGQTAKVTEVYRRLQQIDPGMADEFFNEFVLP